jgi:hypothetical protein
MKSRGRDSRIAIMPERLGLVILPVLRIADSPLYAVECRHRADYWYSCE